MKVDSSTAKISEQQTATAPPKQTKLKSGSTIIEVVLPIWAIISAMFLTVCAIGYALGFVAYPLLQVVSIPIIVGALAFTVFAIWKFNGKSGSTPTDASKQIKNGEAIAKDDPVRATVPDASEPVESKTNEGAPKTSAATTPVDAAPQKDVTPEPPAAAENVVTPAKKEKDVKQSKNADNEEEDKVASLPKPTQPEQDAKPAAGKPPSSTPSKPPLYTVKKMTSPDVKVKIADAKIPQETPIKDVIRRLTNASKKKAT